MSKLKYLVYERAGHLVPIVFASLFEHAEMRPNGTRPLAAGFVEFKAGKACCFGASKTLKVVSRGEEDEKVIDWWMTRGE